MSDFFSDEEEFSDDQFSEDFVDDYDFFDEDVHSQQAVPLANSRKVSCPTLPGSKIILGRQCLACISLRYYQPTR